MIRMDLDEWMDRAGESLKGLPDLVYDCAVFSIVLSIYCHVFGSLSLCAAALKRDELPASRQRLI